MPKVNMLEAKTTLSKLVEAVESGKEKEIILARNGKPVARIVPLEEVPLVDVSKRLGIAEGEFGDFTLEEFDASNEEIWRSFHEKPLLWEPPGFNEPKGKK